MFLHSLFLFKTFQNQFNKHRRKSKYYRIYLKPRGTFISLEMKEDHTQYIPEDIVIGYNL